MSADATVQPRRGRRSSEDKAQSRWRLLEAALDILDTDGEAGLTTAAVTRAAGMAQPSIYAHFANVDELVSSLLTEYFDSWGRATVEARRVARESRTVESYRDTWLIPIQGLLAEPRLFRIVIRNRHDLNSRLGVWSAGWMAQQRELFVADLRELGFPFKTAAERRRLQMIADAVLAMTAELVEGHLQGRYPRVDEMVDVLMMFADGYLATAPGR